MKRKNKNKITITTMLGSFNKDKNNKKKGKKFLQAL